MQIATPFFENPGYYQVGIAYFQELDTIFPNRPWLKENIRRLREMAGLPTAPRSAELSASLEWVAAGQNAQAEITELEAAVETTPTAAGFIDLSHRYYRTGRFRDTIAASRRALEIDPQAATAFNNICAAFNGLEEWALAISACTRALEIAPEFGLAQDNLNWARAQLPTP